MLQSASVYSTTHMVSLSGIPQYVSRLPPDLITPAPPTCQPPTDPYSAVGSRFGDEAISYAIFSSIVDSAAFNYT